MPAPANADEFVDLIRKSGVVEEARMNAYIKQLQSNSGIPNDVSKFAGVLVRDGVLTFFQAEQFLLGKWKRFTIGKYKVLERLGSGGMGQVFLCEHKLMRRKVAVKVLPTAKAEDSSSLERFYREARAVAALDHPNIVRAYDIDQDDNLHFLVMEYVDGASLQDVIKKFGPMDVTRACHYIYWSAIGLQHAHEAGLIHRDIKPGNILIDRQGIVKILDMGLARFFNDDEDLLTKKYDENVLGTADYLAPEQALDSHSVDGRADIYSLGATFYFMLTGHPPFTEGTVAQKLIWHQTRNPKPIGDLRPEVPRAVLDIVEKMMAKDPANRFQSPSELAEALNPLVQTPIEVPPEREMPQLSAAAQAVGGGPTNTTIARQPQQSQRPATGSPPRAPGSDVPLRTSSGSGRGSQPVRVHSNNTAAVSDDAEQTKRRSGHVASVPKYTAPATTSDPAVWESLAADTNDNSRQRTDRQKTPLPVKPLPEPEPLEDEPEELPHSRQRRKLPMLPLIIGGAVLILGGVSFLIYHFGFRSPSTKPTDTATGVDVTRLTVSSKQGSGQYSTVREALANAKENSHIVLLDSPWEEELTIQATHQTRGVVIEGAENKEIVWRIPKNRDAEKVISLQKSEGLTLRNLTIEGNDRTKTGLLISGNASGLVVEDLTIRNMNESGIRFYDCKGTDGKPAVVQRVRIVGNNSPTVKTVAGIHFVGSSETKGAGMIFGVNEWIVIRDCRLEGPFVNGAFTIDGSVFRVELKQNRIYKCTDGVHFGMAKTGQSFKLMIGNNTFHTISGAAIRFKNAGLLSQKQNTDKQNIELERNYFHLNNTSAAIVKSDDKYEQFQFLPKPSENARHTKTREGLPSINCVIADTEFSTNPDDNKTFLRYDRRSPLFRLPSVGNKTVGAPPPD